MPKLNLQSLAIALSATLIGCTVAVVATIALTNTNAEIDKHWSVSDRLVDMTRVWRTTVNSPWKVYHLRRSVRAA